MYHARSGWWNEHSIQRLNKRCPICDTNRQESDTLCGCCSHLACLPLNQVLPQSPQDSLRTDGDCQGRSMIKKTGALTAMKRILRVTRGCWMKYRSTINGAFPILPGILFLIWVVVSSDTLAGAAGRQRRPNVDRSGAAQFGCVCAGRGSFRARGRGGEPGKSGLLR